MCPAYFRPSLEYEKKIVRINKQKIDNMLHTRKDN